MKVQIRLFRYLSMIVLCLGIFISSCTKNDLVEVEDTSDLVLKSAHEGTCQLIAGQNMLVGTVSYVIGATDITVTIETNGWFLSEVHIYVGEKDDIPRNKKGIKIGQFPVSVEGLSSSSETFVLPYDAIWSEPILAVHAVVNDGLDQEETAWGNCCPVLTVKARLSGLSNGWTVSDGLLIYDTPWCDIMGINPYVDGIYDLITLFVTPGTVVGTIEVDGSTVTITPDEGYEICDSYVYVGSIGGIPLDGSCPDYPNFPYTNTGAACSETPHEHTVTPPDCHSESFEEAFDISRWGWIIEL